ncbi:MULTISPECIES: helix-turn-helix domain-containing protein [Erwiniaceae]|uniref:helix-turn-helix domain-containing protein n=1 Tax=Erwiniaceae TaxID=1903409 RepID=UPI00190DD87E|nr:MULTISPECIES: helix-turn-helix domain-containing protein [Erwiniaceae]MBK0090008.1 helix-turn-helix domain-containing protein [Erwinia sp. S59]MBK0126328.1 helix-turn-helix domain-containing protein [Pantoea sp. S61]
MTNKVNITTDTGSDIECVNEAVSASIKNHRKNLKISLDELSRRAGVSKGMLVEVEKGKANPSIAILCKIAAALGVSVADIVNVTHAPDSWLIESQNIPVLWKGEKGGSARLLAGTSGPDMIELWRWEMQPGEVFESVGHPTGTFELLHVERGTLGLATDTTELQVTAGSSAVAKTDMPHHYKNLGEALLVFTMTVAEIRQ